MTEAWVGDDPQTAMLLTQQEWADLAAMVRHYRLCTEWVDNPRQAHEATPDHYRQRALAQRIIDAS